jgi:molecular chaperone DnaK
MENARDEAGVEYSSIDKILLVGGSTRMPVVTECIKEETGINPSAEVHPDEAVAIGAAYHVLDVLKEQKSKATQSDCAENKILDIVIPEVPKQYTFTDVTSHGIGVVVQNEYDEEENSVILPKGVAVPSEYTGCYVTTVPYQEKLYVQVTQGEESDLRNVTVIGTAEIQIPPREKIVGIEVTISCDENSIIHVRVYDQDLKRDLGEMKIDRISNLSDEEIEKNQIRISKLDISGD